MWLQYMTCALPSWIIACPLSVSIQLSFHSLLFFVLSLCQNSSWRCLLKKTLLITYQNYTKLSFWHVLPHSLPISLLPASSFRCFWKQFIPSFLLLLSYSFILAKPVGEPPSSLSLSILVSKRPGGISDSLTDCPRLHLKAGWLNFSFTFLQLSSNQYLLKL